MLTKAGDAGAAIACARRHFLGGDDHRRATGHRHHDLEHVQRVGDHLAVEHVLDRQGLAEEAGIRVGERIGALIHRDLGHRHRVIAVLRGVALRDHCIAGVLSEVTIGQVELGLGRAESGAVATEAHRPRHPARIFVGCERRHPRRDHAQHGLAQAKLDRRRCTPHHGHRRTTAQVDDFGKVQRQAEVLGRHRGHKNLRFMELRSMNDHAVDVRRLEAGIGQRASGQIGHLFQMEHLRRGRIFLRLVLRGADDCCVSFETHALSPH